MFKPSKKFVESLGVGDKAPDCFGNLSTITRISFTGNDPHGKAYVGVDTI